MNFKHITYFLLLAVYVFGILFLSIKKVSLFYFDIITAGFHDQSLFPLLTNAVNSIPHLPAVASALFGIMFFVALTTNKSKDNGSIIFLLLFQPIVFISIILYPLLVILPIFFLTIYFILPQQKQFVALLVLAFFNGLLFPDIALTTYLFFCVLVLIISKSENLKSLIIPTIFTLIGVIISLTIDGKFTPSFIFFKFNHLVFVSFIFAIPLLLLLLFKFNVRVGIFFMSLIIMQYIIESFFNHQYLNLPFILMLQIAITFPLLVPNKSNIFKSKNMQIALISLIIFSLFVTLFHFKTIFEIDSFTYNSLINLDTPATLKIVTFSVFYVILFFLILFLLQKDAFRNAVLKYLTRIILILLISNFIWKCVMQPLIQERKEKIKLQSANHV